MSASTSILDNSDSNNNNSNSLSPTHSKVKFFSKVHSDVKKLFLPKSASISEHSPCVPRSKQVHKILLLGSGQSGKSTIYKQFQYLYEENSFQQEERQRHLCLLSNNCVEQMNTLINLKNVPPFVASEQTETAIKSVGEKAAMYDFMCSLTSQIADDISYLWEDPSMPFRLDAERGLPNAKYVLPKVKSFASPGYIPSVEDCIRSRMKTTGIVETVVPYDKTNGQMICMMDTGGERNERKKWIRCFHNVSMVLVVVNLLGYCLTLHEDDTVNQMMEDLILFHQLVNAKVFQVTPICLLFTRKDSFREAIEGVPCLGVKAREEAKKYLQLFLLPDLGDLIISYCSSARHPLNVLFPEYSDGDDYERALNFVHLQFRARDKRKKCAVPLQMFDVCAVDSEEMKHVFPILFNTIPPRHACSWLD